jgi:hypothetical protein
VRTLPRLAIPLLAAAVALGGCGVASRTERAATSAETLKDLALSLKQAGSLTITATYRTASGASIQLTQAPPETALRTPTGRLVIGPGVAYLCASAPPSPPRSSASASADPICQQRLDWGTALDTQSLVSLADHGFVSPEVAAGLVQAAAIYPNAAVTTERRHIAGLASQCVSVSGLVAAEGNSGLRPFSICATDEGLLTSFSQTTREGGLSELSLISAAHKADAQAFTLPHLRMVPVRTFASPSD